MGIDRSSRSNARQRKMFQRFASGTGFIIGDGLFFDDQTATLSLGLATDPALEFVGGLLTVKVKASGGLQKDTNGLSIDLDANPGLVLGAGGIKILVDPAGALTLGAAGIVANVAAARGTAIVSNTLAVDLRDATPGLELAATGLGVLLDATNPGLQLTTGLKILLNGASLTLAAGGLSVTAPAGQWSVTAIKTANYNAVIGELVRCDASGGSFTVTLPTAVGVSGQSIIVKPVVLSVLNSVTVNTTGGQTIDGAASATLLNTLVSQTYTSDGANWLIT